MARIFKPHSDVTQGLPTALSTKTVDILQEDYSLAYSLFTAVLRSADRATIGRNLDQGFAVDLRSTRRPVNRARSRRTTDGEIIMDKKEADFFV